MFLASFVVDHEVLMVLRTEFFVVLLPVVESLVKVEFGSRKC